MTQIRFEGRGLAAPSQPAPADSPLYFLIVHLFFWLCKPLDKFPARCHNNGKRQGSHALRGNVCFDPLT